MRVMFVWMGLAALSMAQEPGAGPEPKPGRKAVVAQEPGEKPRKVVVWSEDNRFDWQMDDLFDWKMGSLDKLDKLKALPRIQVDVGDAMAKLNLDIASMMPKISVDLAPMMPQFSYALQPKTITIGRGNSDYQRGVRALDRRQYDEAVNYFTTAATASDRADGALYWKAYALGKLGRTTDATAALDELAKSHPKSGWLNDAKALRVELAQAAGRPVSPEDAVDDDIKLMAINSLMQSDPERSVPLLEKLLQTKSSPKLRERALFVLSQSNTPRAREAVVRVAKGSLNPDLQLVALRNLGAVRSTENQQVLSEVYSSSNDTAVKKEVLRGFMASGERVRMLSIAKSEPNVELRKDAIRYLGAMGAGTELAAIYASEQSVEARGEILNAMMAANNSAKILEIAKTEKDQRLRERAINMLGHSRNPANVQALVDLYGASQETDMKKRILRSLGAQRNAQPVIDIARKETNAELKRTAVEMLSRMKSKEATDFLMELLNK